MDVIYIFLLIGIPAGLVLLYRISGKLERIADNANSLEDLRQVVENLREEVEKLAKTEAVEELKKSSPRERTLEELARERTRATGWDAENVSLERTVEVAIRETGASSLAQMGLAIKAARRLGGGTLDEKALSNLVRSRLQGKQ